MWVYPVVSRQLLTRPRISLSSTDETSLLRGRTCLHQGVEPWLQRESGSIGRLDNTRRGENRTSKGENSLLMDVKECRKSSYLFDKFISSATLPDMVMAAIRRGWVTAIMQSRLGRRKKGREHENIHSD